MNGFCYIFFFSTVLAGLGIRESIAVCPAESPEGTAAEAAEPQIVKEQKQPGTAEPQIVKEQKQPGTAEPQIVKEQKQPGTAEPQIVKEQKQPGTAETQAGEEQDQPGQDDNTQVTDKEKGIVEKRDKAEKIDNADEKAAETAEGKEAVSAEEKPEQKREVKFIENPLPLPKKHEKRVMDYKLNSDKDLGGYDVFVADDDDFDH